MCEILCGHILTNYKLRLWKGVVVTYIKAIT